MFLNNSHRTNILTENLTALWSESVRASHDFLTEDDIVNLMPFVKMGLCSIETLIVKYNNDLPIAFMGIQNHKIEMLFVAPLYFGNGIGKDLIKYAIENYDVRYVDVNEQNPSAIGFYEHLGFRTFERTEFDDQGNPFPILKMKL